MRRYLGLGGFIQYYPKLKHSIVIIRNQRYWEITYSLNMDNIGLDTAKCLKLHIVGIL